MGGRELGDGEHSVKMLYCVLLITLRWKCHGMELNKMHASGLDVQEDYIS